MADRALPEYFPGAGQTRLSSSATVPDLRAVALVALAYYVGCLIAFASRFPFGGLPLIWWPPNAILLSSLLLLRRRAWPLILGASFAAHGIAHAQANVPVSIWPWQFFANGLQAVLAASIVLRFSGRRPRFDTLRGVSVFLGGAAFVAPMIASAFAAPIYLRMGWASDFWSAWGTRTLNNIVTTSMLVPPLVLIFGENRRLLTGLTPARALEFIALLLGLFAVDVVALTVGRALDVGLPPTLYACMPFLVWASLRFGTSGLSICFLAVVSLSIAALGRQSPSSVPVHLEIVSIQLLVAIWVSPLMLLSAALEESRRARGTEEALYHSEAKNAGILRALPDLMFVLSKDSEHRYLDYYTSSTGALFTPPVQFLGKRMRDVLPADLATAFEEVFERTIESGEPVVLEYTLPVGREDRVYEARVVSCDDDRFLSIVRDITERKNAEQAVQKAHQALARMSRASALGELAASIAHEVQQPLTAIGTNAAACARWLDQDPTPHSQVREALADIMEDAKRAGQVIRRTRELFSGAPRENVSVELGSAIREVLALMRHRAERDGEFVELQLDGGPLIVQGDRIQLQQVLMNLVANGLEAMHDMTGPRRLLLVRAWRQDRSVHVAVRDTGRGFAADDIERIFDPFYTTKSDGLGIGLAISRSIVRAHGGTLEGTVNAEGGATFEFTVPAVADAVPARGSRRSPTE